MPSLKYAVTGGQPRSVVGALLAGHWFLCVGTAAGDLLYMQLLPGGDGRLQVGACAAGTKQSL